MSKEDFASLRYVPADAFAAAAGVSFCSRPEQRADDGNEATSSEESPSSSLQEFDQTARMSGQYLPYAPLLSIAISFSLLWVLSIFI